MWKVEGLKASLPFTKHELIEEGEVMANFVTNISTSCIESKGCTHDS